MEDILKQILNKLDSLEKGQQNLEKGQLALEKRQQNLENGQLALEKRQQNLENGQLSLEKGQESIVFEQSEMRKEVAFYYGSMMKKFDEGKTELSSEIKQITTIQKEHQSVLEYLNEKQ